MRWNRMIVAAVVFLSLFSNNLRPASASGGATPFNDISGSFARQEIIDLYKKNIITGTSAYTFSPTKPISRAEFITILNRLLGLKSVNSLITPFTDVAKSAWYYGGVQAAVQLGLAEGVSSYSFAPGKKVTRQEAAVLIIRALKQSAADHNDTAVFNDASLIAAWAEASVASAQRLGLVKGDDNGRFRPNAPISRQETAVIIHRVLQNKSWAAELNRKARSTIQLGWQYNQTTAQYEQTVLQSNVNTLSPRWYFLAESGAITDTTDYSLVTWAKKHNKAVWAMVGNRSDASLTHRILSNSSMRTTAINNLLAIVKKYSLDGLNIDFENVVPEDRASLTAFIKELSSKLHANGSTLAVNVSPDLGTDWTDAFNYYALGQSADYIILMGYDEHYNGSPEAGSNSSLPYVANGLNILLQEVPNEKVILGLPLYNKDWSVGTQGNIISTDFISLLEQNNRILAHSARPIWDSKLGQYTVKYTKNGIAHYIWVEDGRSLSGKYELAIHESLAGFAYWYVGSEGSDIWASLSNAEKFYGYSF